MRAKVHHFAHWVHKQTHRLAIRHQALQQAHRLEEIEAVRLALERVPDLGCRASSRHGIRQSAGFRDYIKILCPALGGHCSKSSLLWTVRTTSWLKLFNETYNARKRSRTLANR